MRLFFSGIESIKPQGSIIIFYEFVADDKIEVNIYICIYGDQTFIRENTYGWPVHVFLKINYNLTIYLINWTMLLYFVAIANIVCSYIYIYTNSILQLNILKINRGIS